MDNKMINTFKKNYHYLYLITIFALPALIYFEDKNLFTVMNINVDVRFFLYTGLTFLFLLIYLFNKLTLIKLNFNFFFLGFVLLNFILTFGLSPSLKAGIPTSIRFLLYFLVLQVMFNFFINKDFKEKYFEKIINIMILSSFVPICFAIYQYITKTAPFFNGGYRLTGTFGMHALAFAMLLQVIGIIIYSVKLRNLKFNWYLIYFIILSFILIQTHSRLIMATFFFAIVCIDLITKRYFRVIPIFIVMIGFILIEKTVLERIMSTFNIDNSTSFRLYIYKVMTPLIDDSMIWGYGTGSFPVLFEKLTKIKDVAPHNDYLGLIIDNGLIGLLLYLGLQISLLYFLGKQILKNSGQTKNLAIAAFFIYFNTNVLNFIENPNYFFINQIIIWTIIGMLIGIKTGDKNNEISIHRSKSATS
jgi:O-antigen ligase